MVSSIASTVLGCRQPICSNCTRLPTITIYQSRTASTRRRGVRRLRTTELRHYLELSYEWNGELAISQVFRAWDALETAATEKRRELEARGWQSAPPG